MAGIGFVLRKLARQDNLMGVAFAYAHAALASSGPWLFTILALAGIALVGEQVTSKEVLHEFRIIIIYNFSFSLVLTGPVAIIATRYLADAIYKKDVTTARGLLVVYMVMALFLQLPLVFWFYVYYAHFPMDVVIAAIVNYMLIVAIWVTTVFLTALKDYLTITITFAMGTLVALLATSLLAHAYHTFGMLMGFSLGLSVILASIVARIFAEYPYRIKYPPNALGYIIKYWELALGALLYNVAIWIDKWMLWFAPEASLMANGLRLYPHYDSAMFIAYLLFVPGMALFIFSIETQFFEKYLHFYRSIQRGATLNNIRKSQFAMIGVILSNGRNLLVLQASLTIFVILFSPQIFEYLNIPFVEITIFRYGVLGVLFHLFSLTFITLLSYFDHRRAVISIQLFFCVTNAAFTWITMELGYSYYGFGYFASCLCTFALAATILGRYITELPYHTFITRNASVK